MLGNYPMNRYYLGIPLALKMNSNSNSKHDFYFPDDIWGVITSYLLNTVNTKQFHIYRMLSQIDYYKYTIDELKEIFFRIVVPNLNNKITRFFHSGSKKTGLVNEILKRRDEAKKNLKIKCDVESPYESLYPDRALANSKILPGEYWGKYKTTRIINDIEYVINTEYIICIDIVSVSNKTITWSSSSAYNNEWSLPRVTARIKKTKLDQLAFFEEYDIKPRNHPFEMFYPV